MARNKKLQREERRRAELAAPKPMVHDPKPEVPVEPPKPVQQLPKKKPPKKRYVRPPRQVRTDKPIVLARGTTYSARVLGSGAAKLMAESDGKAAKDETQQVARVSTNDTGPQGPSAGHFQSGRRQAARRGTEG